MKPNRIGAAVVSGAFALALALPLAAQQAVPGPSHAGYDPNAPTDGHVHEGELGEKYLIIEQKLKCNCSCKLDVHQCQFTMMCAVSPGWSKRIRDELAAGIDPEVIEAGFVADYGTSVLMAPPPEGFNLLGYLLPALAIVTAGMLVGIIARGGATRQALAPVEQLTDEDAERLRAAMKKLEAEQSPDW